MWAVLKQMGIDWASCRATLGPLEAQVMEVLWGSGECSVRQVLERMPRGIAYTTVMTTLVRLAGKKLVERRKSGHAYLYSARVTADEWREIAAEESVIRFLATPNASREQLVSCLLEAICRQDAGLLTELEDQIQERRRKYTHRPTSRVVKTPHLRTQ